MRKFAFMAAAVAASISLAGCGGEQVDARQLDWHNGLAYKRGATDPYTGTVSWVGSIPDVVDTYWNNNIDRLVEVRSTQALAGCLTTYVKGQLDGPVKCTGPNGDTLLTMNFKGAVYDGDFEIYNPANGAIHKRVHWASGHPDGKAVIYAADGKQPVLDVVWANGTLNGPAKSWDDAGNVLADTEMRQGSVFSGAVKEMVRLVPFPGSIATNAVRVLNQQIPMFNECAGLADHDDGHPSYLMTTWSGGALNGPVQMVDGSGNVVLVGAFKDGQLEGKLQFTAVNQAKETLSFSTGKLDGEQRVLASDGKQLLLRRQWKGGVLDGEAKEWATDGTLLTDVQMSQGKIISGKVTEHAGDGVTGIKRVDASNDLNARLKVNSALIEALGGLANTIQSPVTVISTWSNGTLEGPVQYLDVNGKAVLSGTFKGGKFDGLLQFVSANSRQTVSLMFQDGQATSPAGIAN